MHDSIMGKKVKVLMFSNSMISSIEIKSTGNWVLSLAKALSKYSLEIEFIIAYHVAKQKVIIKSVENGINTISIPIKYSRSIISNWLANWMILDRLSNVTEIYLEIIRNEKPDIIQIFGFEGPFISLIGKTEIPTIVHIQGLTAPISYKQYLRISRVERIMSSSVKSIIYEGNLPFVVKRRRIKRLNIENSIYGKCMFYLGRTEWDRRCTKAISPQAEYYCCQEIMRPQFYQAQWEPTGNLYVRIFTTIRQSAVKNIDIIFEVANILEKYHPKFTYEWLVAGLTESDMLPKIMLRRGIKPRKLFLLGKLDSKQLIEHMLVSDLFVYPSAIETSCNAVQEAMLVGIPIIATFAGGLSTTIDNNQTGILVQEGEPYSMVGAILETVERYENAIIMAKKARMVAHERHNPQKVVSELIKIYKTILFRKV